MRRVVGKGRRDPKVNRQVLLARSTTGGASARDSAFRDEIIKRDARCIFTDHPASFCQAAHIVPHAKGDEVHPYPASRLNKT